MWNVVSEPLADSIKYTQTILVEMVRGKGLGNLCSLRFVACDVSRPRRMLLVNLLLISVVSLQVDRLYGWRSFPQNDIINVIKSQTAHTKSEFDERATLVMTQLAEEVKRSDDFWLPA